MAKIMSIQRTAEKADRTEKGQGTARSAPAAANGKLIALVLVIVVAVLCLGIMMIRTHAVGQNEDVSKMPPKMGMSQPTAKP